MELNINSPKYYKDIYGIDSEISYLCQEMYCFFKEKKYSDVINVVGIIPIIAPSAVIIERNYKEVKKCAPSYGFADVNLFVDYEKYVEASIDDKKSLIVRNVVDSIRAIKTKGKIDFKLFESDMKQFCAENNINYIA